MAIILLQKYEFFLFILSFCLTAESTFSYVSVIIVIICNKALRLLTHIIYFVPIHANERNFCLNSGECVSLKSDEEVSLESDPLCTTPEHDPYKRPVKVNDLWNHIKDKKLNRCIGFKREYDVI